MIDQPVVVKLPSKTYEHLRDNASRGHRSVEDVLSTMVALFSAQLPEDLDEILDTMQAYTVDQLWHVVSMRLNMPDERHMDDLIAKSKHTSLSQEEEAELNTLIKKFQRLILLRSEALLQLKLRGYDMDSYLNLSE